MEFLERPPRYRDPNLDPTGVRLRPKRLAEGVYALMASRPARDNSEVVVGEHGALVVDAGINPAMARQIQQVVRRLTDRPIPQGRAMIDPERTCRLDRPSRQPGPRRGGCRASVAS